jgi:hypothetical protein
MDNNYDLDVGEILRTVESAEVLTFRFVVIGQGLLIDTRFSAVDGPLLKLVPAVKSPEERFRSLKEIRPRFRLPEKICAIWWPKHINSLATYGVWQAIAKRVIDSGFPGAAQQCEGVFGELLAQEEQEVKSAILGKGYQALWECCSPGQQRRS